jgi:hypothetical protein
MSEPKKSKDNTLSSITINGFSNTIPGVTQLLNPKVMAERYASKQKEEALNQPIATVVESIAEPEVESKPQVTTTQIRRSQRKTGLSRFGVHFELQFEDDMGVLRFTRAKTHSEETFDEWHRAFFTGMKIDLRALEINVSFQEFSAEKSIFHRDAFALPDGFYLQFVRSRENSAVMFVLISERSLVLNKEEIYRGLEGYSSSGSGSGSDSNQDGDGIVIELAS